MKRKNKNKFRKFSATEFSQLIGCYQALYQLYNNFPRNSFISNKINEILENLIEKINIKTKEI